ncbi:MAG: NAD(P)-dependent oxidoreductase [Candidatus Thiodiazotropha sp.]|nr:NAD(P)-dependent oxidoreductase [Candidatus Thiodiazotropha taylori]MBT3058780.1 NAD(P)-dependent oxidoreductase [Candidatus Thiodiazotropha sp. (ex Lucina pensylvanica)]MBT3061888.1 NAD(P)-dependent oxidoreductase [Candidatus Thiodiazotropha sp. (ex Lucina pensylvanica)]MBV2093250.1 NAD(P)-dependent oxidoreductase [Candidatus Thiodiazotropha sp. (ex Codakia orbicularis)]
MEKRENEIIGFAGLGLMGRPMAARIADTGTPLLVWNRSPEKAQAFCRRYPGVESAPTPADLARQSTTVVVMLSDSTAVEEVVCGEDGLLASIAPDSLLIDMGTTAVPLTQRLAALAAAKGAEFVDAPVSGGVVGAEQGSLSIMAGGAEEAVERARHLFGIVGQRVVHIGGCGSGQVAKMANQIIVGLNIGAVSEAFLLAESAAADLGAVREALAGGFAASRVLELHGQRMIEEDFEPGGRCRTQLKDLQQALDFAAELGISLPATELCRDLYRSLLEAGDGDLDHSALIREIRRLSSG